MCGCFPPGARIQLSRIVLLRLIAPLCCLALPASAQAGMPSIDLTDVARMRLDALSFFAVGFLLSAWGLQRLWNMLQRDIPNLPRLTYRGALGGTFLWGMLFVLVLTMISGARELMTPGAWEKQGVTYKIASDSGVAAERATDGDLTRKREQRLQQLHVALLAYAARHDGEFPPDESVASIPAEYWQLPERFSTRYFYVPGRSSKSVSDIIAYEPQVYADRQLVLLSDGRLVRMSGEELRSALDAGSTP